MVVGMIDYGTCSLSNLQPCNESILDGIRVIFKKDKRKEAVEYCAKVKALYNYALDALHEGRADEALPIFQRAEKLNVKVLFDKLIPLAVSSCYWVLGDIDKAISTIEDLQKKYNYINPNTLTTLGYFYMLKGNYEKAVEWQSGV